MFEEGPNQEEIEVELERPNNTSRSRGGRPTSSTLTKEGGVSDVQWGLELSAHASRTKNVGLEEVRTDVRQLDEKFNTIQRSIIAVMAKLGIPVKREVGTLLRRGHTCSVDTVKSYSRSPIFPLARSASKKPTSKVIESSGAGDLPIVASPETPSES